MQRRINRGRRGGSAFKWSFFDLGSGRKVPTPKGGHINPGHLSIFVLGVRVQEAEGGGGT